MIFFLQLFLICHCSLTLLLPAQDDPDPKVYVDALLQVHKKHASLVEACFQSDPQFVAALDKVSLLCVCLSSFIVGIDSCCLMICISPFSFSFVRLVVSL